MTKWKKIRKESGDISINDLLEFHAWESCLDEEHIENQSECTMRPLKPSKTLKLSDYCYVGCKFVLPNSSEFTGWIELTGESEIDEWNLAPEIFLDPAADVPKRDITEFSLITNSEFVGASTRVRFYLPTIGVVDEKNAQLHGRDAARALSTSLENLFPIRVDPLQRIKGFPDGYKLTCFSRST